MCRSEAKYMPRHPARAVLSARRKFVNGRFSIFGFRVRRDYGARSANGKVERAGYQNGARGSIQHQMRHTDRGRAELCKVLHTETMGPKIGCSMYFNTKGLFFAIWLSLGLVRAIVRSVAKCAEVRG